MNDSTLSMVAQFLIRQIPQMIVLVGCLIFVVKTGRSEAYVMLAGQAGSIVCGLTYISIGCWHSTFSGPLWIPPLLSGANLICGLAFASGFAWHVLRAAKSHNKAIEGTAR